MEDHQKIVLISSVLKIDEAATTPELQLKELTNWDSVAVMSLIVMLRKNGFNRSLDANQISKLNTIQDIMQLMQ